MNPSIQLQIQEQQDKPRIMMLQNTKQYSKLNI